MSDNIQTKEKESLNVRSGGISYYNLTSTSIIAYLEAYAKKGYLLLTCKEKGKTPLNQPDAHNGCKSASNNLEVIKNWWKRTPNANVGIATGEKSNIWVLDIDQKDKGLDTLKELETEHGEIITRKIRTGGGGVHFYFSYQPGFKNNVSILPGVDIRTDGGYVIAPPSVHANGKAYEVIKDIEPLPAPEWLIKLIVDKNIIQTEKKKINNEPVKLTDKTTAYGRKALEVQCANVRQAASGIRNHTLNKAAYSIGRLIAGGEIEMNEAITALEISGSDAGLDILESKKTINSGITSGRKDPKRRAKKKKAVTVTTNKINNKDWDETDYIRFFAEVGYTFRKNLLDDSVEINGENFDDFKLSKLGNKVDFKLFKHVSEARFQRLWMEAADDNAYHPIKNYFKGLPKASGSIEKLAGYFKTNNDNIFKAYLMNWFCGAVARVFTGEQNATLVLDGAQGIGKSNFVRWLSPLQKFFNEGAIQPNDKDCILSLLRYFIWEISELGSTTRRADISALKAFQSREWCNIRPPFMRSKVEKPPLASFIGTINNEAGFLNDSTGTRRWNVITLDSINWNYSKEIDINDIWSEAYQLYKSGFDYHLTSEEITIHDALNRLYTDKTHIDELLDAYLEFSDEEDYFISTLELVSKLKQIGCTGTDDSISKKVKKWMLRNGRGQPKRKIVGNEKFRGYPGIYPNFPK